ncbi:MAG: ribonuclease Y, partial [Coriobacteriia bacterium]
ESLAESHRGVEKSYAMQAGREIRVMVRPEEVSDVDSTMMAREIAKQIEEELQYPGQIKVMVIRESRAIEYAK